MYKILCLTSGEFIKLNNNPYEYNPGSYLPRLYYFDWHGIDKSLRDNVYLDINNGGLFFNDYDSASWFIRRRLTYNPKRKDEQKLFFMKSIFKVSGITDWEMSKVEYEIVEDNESANLTKID